MLCNSNRLKFSLSMYHVVTIHRSSRCNKIIRHKPSYSLSDYYESLAKELSKSNMYADQNSEVARRCSETASLGMNEELLRILKKYNVKIITSSDAHCPEDAGYKHKELNNLIASS